MGDQGALFELPALKGYRILGRCDVCRTGLAERRDVYGSVTVQHCDRWTVLAPVQGTETGGHCSPDCMYATGPKCNCSCGGANHGAGWGR